MDLEKRVKDLEEKVNLQTRKLNDLDKTSRTLILDQNNFVQLLDEKIKKNKGKIQEIDKALATIKNNTSFQKKYNEDMKEKLEATMKLQNIAMKSLTEKNKKIEALSKRLNELKEALAEKKSSSRLRFLSKGKK